MPNYDPSNLVKAQAKLIGKFSDMARKEVNPVTYLAIKGVTNIAIPNHTQLRTREDRLIDNLTFDRSERALSAGRAHNHTGVSGDSLVYVPSFNTLSDPFSLSIKQADNNIYSYEEMFANEIENSVKNFMKGLEAAAIDFVFNNRSNVNNAAYPIGTFDAVDFVYQIDETQVAPATDSVTITQITDTIMEENFLEGDLFVFCDSLAYDKFRYQANQGAGNESNLSFQHGGKTFIRSIGLDSRYAALAGTYTKGVWISVPMGSIGHLDWIPVQNRNGKDTKIQTYSSLLNPVDSSDYAFHFYPEAVDGTATNGYTQDELEQFELSIDSSFVIAPLGTAGETVAQAFALV